MYTQCPDCGIAFKVTAEVLKQAAGMVRCGGCSNAFNALSFLSESLPKQAAANNADATVPELTPEIVETDSPLPQSISAEQSAALLKTLDDLAGSDIRIEDTGVEWRVLDDDEVAPSAADDVFVDEPLQASATPVDEVLTQSPEIVDSPEIFEADANGCGKTAVDEIRFDDNTPLPDDFDLDDESSYAPQSPEPQAPDVRAEPVKQAELALSEPEEWTDILDEFEDLGAEFANSPEPATPEELQDVGADDADLIDAIEEQVEPIVESHTIEEELAMLDAEEEQESSEAHSEELVVPPMTEEEHTVNMQIDQELMALAIEDEDGFASTMVIPDADAPDSPHDDTLAAADAVVDEDNVDSGFESIVMEGEQVRSAHDSPEKHDDPVRAAQLAALSIADADDATESDGKMRSRLVAGIVGLVVLLGAQAIHQSREALATIPAFNSTVGQIYEAIGQPVQPAWDVSGWRIEATNDTVAVSDGTENITISSRIGNNSDIAMPYPLISISLSDRFLDTIGSRILEPHQYLPGDLDPGEHVAAGNTFNAVMSIESPSTAATGYKLDVCYRLADRRLRCAIDDFK